MPRDYKLVLEANKAAKRAAEEKAAEEERLKTADAFAELQKLAKDAVASGTPPAVEVRNCAQVTASFEQPADVFFLEGEV
jgi:hypothetical protein